MMLTEFSALKSDHVTYLLCHRADRIEYKALSLTQELCCELVSTFSTDLKAIGTYFSSTVFYVLLLFFLIEV